MDHDRDRRDDGEQREHGNVRYLPNTAPGRQVEPREAGEVIEGEIVDEGDYPRLPERHKAALRWRGYRHDVVATGRVLRTAATHPRTRTTGRAVTRHSAYVATGAGVAARRLWEAHTSSRYERMMRAAEAAGDYDRVADWEERERLAKRERHQRAMDWLRAPIQLVKAAAIGVAAFVGLLLGLGLILAVADGQAGRVIDPIVGVVEFVRWAVWFVSAFGLLLSLAAGALVVAILWHLGRQDGHTPRWAQPPAAGEGEQREVVPDEGAILSALGNLNIDALNRALKDGWQPRWITGATRMGKGWHAQLLLPQGVPVEEIAKRKAVLAHNLMRKPIEVWPTEPKNQPGVLDLWAADQGILSGPIDPWPLLTEGSSDYWKGVPVGVNVRGERITARLMAANYLIAGIMGSGKSSLVICLVLGAMLDPLVDIDVYVLAYNVDYDPMRPRLRTLVKGDEDEHIEQAITALRELAGEVTRRGQILDELGGDDPKNTRDIAARDPRMRPRVVVFDEVHELFTHKTYGTEAKELALKVTKKARKTGITLIWATPDADANSLPRGISKTASHRVAFAINDHQGNDAILGTGMHKRGYSATTLVAGDDVGTAMAAGFAPQPGLIRCNYVRKEKGIDEITPVVDRALALREEAGITSTATATPKEERADPLADIADILTGHKRMRTMEVLHRLAERDRATYRDWTFQHLTDYLDGYDAAPYKTGGAMQVSAERVHTALAHRDEHTTTDDEHEHEEGDSQGTS
ncbi:FtsK/SpoIIIE domain-containing protein [Haloechinothrix aidingensis]|uniref:FtsK/SpoIIIE domain-containing protein n=1 Tax=Haloechinothrix aidingensis TaxID=2752311 RepID=UPI0031B5E74D